MKTTIFALAAVLTAGSAFAQLSNNRNEIDLSGVSFKIGTVLPVDNKLSNFSNSFGSVGIEFNVPSSFSSNGESFLSLDYLSRNIGNFEKGGAVVASFNQRFFAPARGARQSYGFVGLGLGFTDFTSSDTVAVLRGGVGINLSLQTYIELAGTLTSTTANNGSLNTVGFYFGYRF